MNYTLSKVKFGTSQKSTIANLSLKVLEEIKDICYVEDIGFVFIHGNKLGLADLSGKTNYEFINDLNKPISLFYTERFQNCYVFENGGRELRYFRKNFNYLIPFLGETYSRLLRKDLKMLTDDIPVMVRGCVDLLGNVYATHDFLNRCIMFWDSEYKYVTSNGKYGLVDSTDLLNCNLFSPQGIGFCDDLYISDTGNNCVRKISNGKVSVFLNNIKSPSKIVIKNKIGYLISGQDVIYFTLDGSHGKVLSSDKLISLDMDKDRNFFILEKA